MSQTDATVSKKKPIYKRWWFIALIVVLVLGIGSSINGGDTKAGESTDPAANASATQAATPTAPAESSSAAPTSTAPKPSASDEPAKSSESAAPTKSSSKLSDGVWNVESLKVKDSLGDFSGTARITNTGDSKASGAFTVTVFKAGDQVASLMGFANDAEAGKTVTVQLISTDAFVKGPYTFDFQNDF